MNSLRKKIIKIFRFFEKNILGSIKYARKIGVQVGDNCRFVDQPNWGSEPYLISIGNHVLISFKVTFITHDASTWCFREKDPYKNVYKFGKISVGDNCFLWAHSIILPNVKIGNDCIIGAGSVVTKNVPDGEVWAGVPAKFITSTREYADKCKQNKLPYDDILINTDPKNEMLRVLSQQ